MQGVLALLLACIISTGLHAETVVAARHIRYHSVLTADDLALIDTDIAGGFRHARDVVGMEARVMLYAGRPILASDLGPPAVIERNQIVSLTYQAGPLVIHAEGRALSRAGVGDLIRVLNMSSRTAVSGHVGPKGNVIVAGVNGN